MPPEVRKLLTDALDSADAILDFTSNKSFEHFLSERLLRAGVYHEFAVIGEALSQLRQWDQPLLHKISEHWRIIGFRNQIIHGYARLDDEITWRIVEIKLPILKKELTDLLATG